MHTVSAKLQLQTFSRGDCEKIIEREKNRRTTPLSIKGKEGWNFIVRYKSKKGLSYHRQTLCFYLMVGARGFEPPTL